MTKMLAQIVCVLILSLFGGDSMTLDGPPITRYNPCGLGVIYFERIKDDIWKGVLDLSSINDTNILEIEVKFEKQMVLYGISVPQQSLFSVKNNGLDVVIRPKSYLSKLFYFLLFLNDDAVSKVPTVKKIIINNYTYCDDIIKESQNISNFYNATTSRYRCGHRSLDHTELTSVRTNATAGDWPWHVALLVKNPVTKIDQYMCGGNIITESAVLTAGHCVTESGIIVDPSMITILAGVTNLTDLNQFGRQVHTAVRVILHPAFSDAHTTADLAIVKVTGFRFTEYVQPVCTWGPLYDKSLLIGKEAIVIGFGAIENNKRFDILRSVYTEVQNDSACIAYSPAIYAGLLNEFTFCAGYGPSSNINPGKGDSGGGLVMATIQKDLRIVWFLHGIVSKCRLPTGHIKCDPKSYLVYTNVGPHYAWILHNAY